MFHTHLIIQNVFRNIRTFNSIQSYHYGAKYFSRRKNVFRHYNDEYILWTPLKNKSFFRMDKNKTVYMRSDNITTQIAVFFLKENIWVNQFTSLDGRQTLY